MSFYLLLTVGVLCLVGAELGQLAFERSAASVLPAFWPPAGVLVGALLLPSHRRSSMVLLSGGAVMLVSLVLHHGAFGVALAVSLLVLVDAALVAGLVRRFTPGGFAVDRLPHALLLVACAAAVPLATGLLATTVPALRGVVPDAPFWRVWWLAEVIGILVTTPLVIVVAGALPPAWASLRSWRTLEYAAGLAAALVAIEAVFGEWLPAAVRVPAFVLPFLLWPAFRFGPGGATGAVFAMACIALWHAARGEGPAALVSGENILLRTQTGVMVGAATLFLLASTVAERKRVAHDHAALANELQQALSEIRTLRGLIPICAWCHRIRDDAGLWQEIDQYLDAHTDATFSHGICPGCAEQEHQKIADTVPTTM